MNTPINPTVDAINGLCHAASRLNYHEFCALLGWSEDAYSADKYADLRQVARLLGRFDNGVLTTLVKAGLES